MNNKLECGCGVFPIEICPLHPLQIADTKDCSCHTNITCKTHWARPGGIDYSKDNVYDAIGRPDLKPREDRIKCPSCDWYELAEWNKDSDHCECTNTSKCIKPQIKCEPETEDWEKEFDNLFIEECGKWRIERAMVKPFIRSLLTKARSEGYREAKNERIGVLMKEVNDEYREEGAKEALEAYKAQLQKAVSEIEKNKQSLPKAKCLNAESHLFGSCFNCEKIKGGNEAIDTALAILKKLTD